MSDELTQAPAPSPEVTQLVLLGQLDDAVTLYAKQAEIDAATARAELEKLAEQSPLMR
jgi:hypothetical protein